MNKKFISLFIGLLSVLLFACNQEAQEVKFRATIEQINEDWAIVVDSKGGRIFVDLSVNRAVTFQVGDEIEVGYDGVMRESSPAQIKTLSVELVE